MILWFYEEKIVILVRSKFEQVPNSKKNSAEHALETNRRPVNHYSAPSFRKSHSEAALWAITTQQRRHFCSGSCLLFAHTPGTRNSRILRCYRHMAIKYYGKLLHWLETSQWNKTSLDKGGFFPQQCIVFSTVITAKALTDQASEINSVLFCSTDKTTASY